MGAARRHHCRVGAAVAWRRDSGAGSAGADGRHCCRVACHGQRRASPEYLGQLLAGNRRPRARRRDRFRARSRQRAVTALRADLRQHAADDPQHSASCDDPAGDPVVRHRRGGKDIPGRARRVFPDLRQHAARHPHRRSATGRNGPHLRDVGADAVPARDPAGRTAVDSASGCVMPSASCGSR